jgi:replicative DNA helicase Mcm
MFGIIGKINSVATNKAVITKFLYEECLAELSGAYDVSMEELQAFFDPKLTLKFDDEIVDDLIKLAGETCKIVVEGGKILSVAPINLVEKINEELEKTRVECKVDLDTILCGSPASLRGKIQEILDIITRLQNASGMAEEGAVIEEASKRGLREDEIRMIMRKLLREGTIWSPKDGFLKVT